MNETITIDLLAEPQVVTINLIQTEEPIVIEISERETGIPDAPSSVEPFVRKRSSWEKLGDQIIDGGVIY